VAMARDDAYDYVRRPLYGGADVLRAYHAPDAVYFNLLRVLDGGRFGLHAAPGGAEGGGAGAGAADGAAGGAGPGSAAGAAPGGRPARFVAGATAADGSTLLLTDSALLYTRANAARAPPAVRAMLARDSASLRSTYRTELEVPLPAVHTCVASGAQLQIFLKPNAAGHRDIVIRFPTVEAAQAFQRHLLRATGEIK
jgi:hypothetical protein